MRIFYFLLFTLATCTSATGQKLASSEFQFTIPASTINFINAAINAKYNVGLYKVTYYTADARGESHLASGLVCVPEDPNVSFPLACYQHGTVADRDDVPSLLMGGYQLAMAFASHGYVTAAPDYVGLGISPGMHPYIHAKTEASAGLDMMLAIREMAETNEDVNLNDQVFISGYSQGGHAALALQKEIEQNQADLFTVTASAPMSGPYDVAGKMVDFTLGDSEYATVAYLAWLTLGYKEVYSTELASLTIENMFKSAYVDDINLFVNEELDLWELNERMTATLIQNEGSVTPKFILQPEILDVLKNDPTHPLSVALADNNLWEWVPQTPTRLYYCKGDDQVTYENAIIAEEYMNANGAPDVTAVRRDTDAAPLDHGGCVIPSSVDAIEWFDTFQNLLSSNQNVSYLKLANIYYADEILTVETEEISATTTLDIYDMTGKLQSTHRLNSLETRIDIGGLQDGFYVVQIVSENTIQNTTKVIKH